MRRIKLLTLFVAAMFATSMWATPASLGDGTGLAWEIVGTTLTITNTVQGGTCAIPDYNVDGDGEKSYPGWYSQAANITAISLPEYLTRIGNHAFAGMTNPALTELTIPATVTSIGDQAIRISHLETLTCLPTTAPTQGYAFITDHAEPFTIIYPCGSGTNYINSWAVYYPYLTPATPCDEAKPDYNPGGLIKYSSYYDFHASTGVLRIYGSGGTGEFMNADQQLWATYRNLITSVVVEEGSPYGITYIAPYTFDGLTELTSVTLPTSLIAISSYAFANCTKLPSITLPSSVQYIDDYAFRNCTGLRSITSLATTPPAPNDPNSTLAFDGVSKSIPVYVPAASVDAYKAADLWKDFANILAIPEPVSLGDGSNLQYQLYAIHAGQPQKALVITLIDENNNGTMPDYNVDEDGDKSYPGWWSERANIASISLPEGLTNIGNHAFAGMTNAALTELSIPSTVTIIGDRSIRISHLQTLTCLRAYPNPLPIDYFVTSLGNSVITEHAENLSIIYPCGNGYNYVHSWVEYFHYLTPAAPCNEPKPDFVQGGKLYYKNDPEYAFSGYSGVLTISGTGAAAFYYESLNNQLWSWYRNLITSLVVEDGITGIGGYLCYGLTELTSVTLPASSVMYIGSYAFANCSKLPSITIPASVQGVNDYAFQNCTGLQSITSLATTPPAAMSDAFAGVNKSIPVYVPAAGLDAYKAADEWKDFTNIIPISSDELNPDHPQNPGNYQLTLNVSNALAGSVTGAGLYPQGTEVEITATANTGYSFSQWSDGVTDASRTITLTKDSTLTAEFALSKFTITFVNEDGITVLASDEYDYGAMPAYSGETPTKAATAQYSYTFAGWTPDIVVVTADATYTATYSATLNEYTVSGEQNISALAVGANTHIIVGNQGHLIVDVPTTIGCLTLTMNGTTAAQVTGIEDLTASTMDAVFTVSARQWFALGVPFDVNIATGIRINGANAAANYGYDYIMDEYDGALRASTQDGWKRVAASATLHPGKLYMIYTAGATAWRLTAANPAAVAEAEAVAVAANPSSIGDHHAGWNGIAIPRLSNASASLNKVNYATFYNNQHSVYAVVPMAEKTFIPAEPFFVQTPAAGSVLFDEDNASPAPWRVTAATEMPTMTVALTNEAQTFTDKAYISMAQDKPNTYLIGHDLEKMQVAAPAVPQLWLEAYDMHLAAYETSLISDSQIIPLGLYAPAEGDYTVAIDNVPAQYDITLMRNGQAVWTISEGAYTASLQAGNNADYALRISHKRDVITDLNTLNSGSAEVRKLIIDGQLYILRGDKTYTVQGQEAK